MNENRASFIWFCNWSNHQKIYDDLYETKEGTNLLVAQITDYRQGEIVFPEGSEEQIDENIDP